ncbi:hypothetical protein Tco_1104719 [Tanacetum coccineum]
MKDICIGLNAIEPKGDIVVCTCDVNAARAIRRSRILSIVRVKKGKPQHDDKGFVDSGCSRSKLEYKFQDQENSEDIFSFGSALKDFIYVVFVPDRNIKRRRRADGASGSDHPPKKLREDHDTSGNVGPSTGEKSLAVIQELFERSTLNVKVIRATTPVLTAAVATTAIAGATSAPVYESSTGPVQHSIFREFASPSAAEADVAGPSQPVDVEAGPEIDTVGRLEFE